VRKGPVNVRGRHVPVPGLSVETDGLRIAHVSDLHLRRFGRLESRAQQLLLSLNYDVLVCTGDLEQPAKSGQVAGSLCRQFFEPLAARTACLAVLGNHDAEELAGAAGLPITFLRDEWRRIEVEGAAVVFAGLDQGGRRAGNLDRALAGAPADLPIVLLAHYPSAVYRVRDERVELVLAGHTHGGQIRLPWIGCVWANDQIPLRLARGLHVVNGRYLHVCAGVGASSPVRARFLCPPEVGILTLCAAGPTPWRAEKGKPELADEVAA
jgi:predicted MPP superfamily phosphohydrolase